MKIIRIATVALMVVVMASCASKKHIVQTNEPTPVSPTKGEVVDAAALLRQQQTAFFTKVKSNATNADNITGKIDFNLKSGSKDITVGGKLMMRRDDVIRIQLSVPLIGMEAGRLEFTKDYVMIVDRIHTEYIKGDYNQIDFLKNNGIDFYALQALFWNMLFVPGEAHLSDNSLNAFTINLQPDANQSAITLNKGSMSYNWQAENNTGLITQTDVEYGKGKAGNTKLTCTYGDFKSLAGKQFPANLTLDMMTSATKKAKQIKIGIKMKSMNTDSDWEPRTTLSKKYKAVSVDDVMKKLMNL
ncbi:MAG: DUF4292 domain-containing protein [Prevotella sp.]|nr:DUF4292 domain-containing protein [Prevotella sp.]